MIAFASFQGLIRGMSDKYSYWDMGKFGAASLILARYRLAAGGYGRTVWLSPAIQDPRRWLEARLGPLMSFVEPQNRPRQVPVAVPPPPCGEQTADEGEANETLCCVLTSLPAEWIGTIDDQREWLAEAVPGGVPVPEVVAVGQPSLDDPDAAPPMHEALIWLSDQIRLSGIPSFESLEPIDPTLSNEETLHRRMRAEWKDRLAWHQARHDLASDVAVRP